jgi:hypothetical protein
VIAIAMPATMAIAITVHQSSSSSPSWPSIARIAMATPNATAAASIVERLARITKDERIVPTLKVLLDDQDVPLQAIAGLRRMPGPEEALEHTRPLTTNSSERIRRAAAQQTRRAQKPIETRSKQAPPAR